LQVKKKGVPNKLLTWGRKAPLKLRQGLAAQLRLIIALNKEEAYGSYLLVEADNLMRSVRGTAGSYSIEGGAKRRKGDLFYGRHRLLEGEWRKKMPELEENSKKKWRR
jgi:hypothetical protein